MKSLLAVFAVPFAVAAASRDHLIQLSQAGNGVIKLNSTLFDVLTSPSRTWSATVHLTALDSKRRCLPCKLVPLYTHDLHSLDIPYREFDPSYNAVAKAWSKVSQEHRDDHFFATLDFDNGQDVFQKVRT